MSRPARSFAGFVCIVLLCCDVLSGGDWPGCMWTSQRCSNMILADGKKVELATFGCEIEWFGKLYVSQVTTNATSLRDVKCLFVLLRLAVPRPKFAALIDPFLTFRPSQYPEHVEILRLRYGRIGAMLEWIDLYCWFAQPIFNTFVKSAQLMWPFIPFCGGTSESARDKAFSIVVVPGRTPPRYYRCARKIDKLFPVVRKGVTVQLKVYLVFRIVGRWCVTQLSNWPDFGTPKVEDGLRISK